MKSYEELARWYTPLEPEAAGAVPSYEESALDVPLRPARLTPVVPFSSGDERVSAADLYSDATPHSVAESLGLSGVSSDGTAHSGSAGFVGGWDDWMAEEDKQVEEEEEIPHAAPVRVLPKPRIAPPKVGSKRRILVAGAVVGVLIVVAGVIAAVLLVGGGGSSAHGGATARAALVDVAGTAGAPGCVERHDGATVTGAGAGGANSGPDAIMWFQHSYYVERSATRARQLVAPGSPVPQADQIQKGIDSVPTGTTYCLQITALAGGKFGVALTEYRPGRTAVEYRQTVSTTVVAGRTMITGIASG